MAVPVPRIGRLPSGARDAITDVAGVTVGHATLDEGDVHTGVTVVRPMAATLICSACRPASRCSTASARAWG